MLSLILMWCTVGAPGDVSIDDFEKPAAESRWKPSQGATVRVEALQGSVPAGGGHALVIDTPAKGIVGTTAGAIGPDWSAFEVLSFRARRESAPSGDDPTFEVWLLEKDKKTKFWRKVTLDRDGWITVELPLRFFRWSDGRVPRSDALDRFAFYFRDAARVTIDDIVVRDEASGPGMQIPTKELVEIAFADPSLARTARGSNLEVVTDAADLDVEALAKRLDPVAKFVRSEFGLKPDQKRRARLVVFESEETYRSFPARLGVRLGADAKAPPSGGFTLFGIATSFFAKDQGIERPVFVHELTHALLTAEADLDNSGEWLQEGAASLVQIHFHPQQDFASIVATGLDQESKRLPLPRLLDGEPIPTSRYWQAATVVDFLLHAKGNEGKFQRLLTAMKLAGSTKLEPHLATVLATDWQKLEAEWTAWCRTRYS